MIKIISNQNPKIKEIIKLRKAHQRKKSDLFIIEGKKEIGLAIDSGIQIIDFFYCQKYFKDQKFIEQKKENVYEVSEDIFKKISLRENPDGILCLAKPRYLQLSDLALKKEPLILIIEALEKPGNLGAILRTADAARLDCVILCEAKTDIYNPNVIRSSLGTVFTNNIIIASNAEIFSWLKAKRIKCYAATPDTDKIYTNMDFKGAKAIIIGTEHAGLSPEWLKQADEKIKIPMRGKIDSLNASVSAAIILFEAVRQRTK